MRRTVTIPAVVLAMLTAAALAPAFQPAPPMLQVDPLWPKPLPNHWLLGSVTGVAVDARDHIWVVHRGYDSLHPRREMGAATDPKTAAECCVPAPPVLEFDAAGTLISHWGGPGDKYQWPESPGGIVVDPKGALWIAAAGPPEILKSASAGNSSPAKPKPQDAHVLKFSRTGGFLLQIGKAGAPGGSDSTTGLNRPAGVDVDPSGTELYVADGFVNRRVVVFDAATGAYKRHWSGAPGSEFGTVSCVKVAKDGTVYVCDRSNNRVQAFDRNGKFLKMGVVSKNTRGTGSVWDIAVSRDPQQRYLYVANGHDQKVFILRRDTLETVGSFGDGGRYPGMFYSVGSVAVDSRGNVYTGETLEGKRVQKFVPRGAGR
jgi:DNA-binding beta-propeller fold protein YncE